MDELNLSVRGCECGMCDGGEGTYYPYVDEYHILRYGGTEEEVYEKSLVGNFGPNVIKREHYVEGKMEIIGETEHLYFVNLLGDVVGLSGSDAKDFIRDLLGENKDE